MWSDYIEVRRLCSTQFEAMKRAAEAYNLKVEFSREDDGRWIADIAALQGLRSMAARVNKRWLLPRLSLCE
jgi:hypothetical protein